MGLRSLALAGRRFETWADIVEAVAQATDYWNAHRYPFTWDAATAGAVSPALHSCRLCCKVRKSE